MQKKDFFAKNVGFLEDTFRKDIKAVLGANEEIINQFVEHLNSAKELRILTEESNWASLAEKTGLTINSLFDMFRPIRYICLVANRENLDLTALIELLATRGVLDVSKEAQKQRILKLSMPLKKLVDMHEVLSPRLPGLMIKTLGTKCSALCEFEADCDAMEDDPTTYTDQVRKLHAYTSLMIDFRSELHDPITIVLNERDLSYLIKTLQLAETQQNILKQKLTNENK